MFIYYVVKCHSAPVLVKYIHEHLRETFNLWFKSSGYCSEDKYIHGVSVYEYIHGVNSKLEKIYP